MDDGVKVADPAISNVGNQAIQKTKLIASTKVEAGKWTTLVVKAQRDKEIIKYKWNTLKSQLEFL